MGNEYEQITVQNCSFKTLNVLDLLYISGNLEFNNCEFSGHIDQEVSFKRLKVVPKSSNAASWGNVSFNHCRFNRKTNFSDINEVTLSFFDCEGIFYKNSEEKSVQVESSLKFSLTDSNISIKESRFKNLHFGSNGLSRSSVSILDTIIDSIKCNSEFKSFDIIGSKLDNEKKLIKKIDFSNSRPMEKLKIDRISTNEITINDYGFNSAVVNLSRIEFLEKDNLIPKLNISNSNLSNWQLNSINLESARITMQKKHFRHGHFC